MNLLLCLRTYPRAGNFLFFPHFFLLALSVCWSSLYSFSKPVYIICFLLHCRTAGNGCPEGNDSPSKSVHKRLRRSYQMKTFKVELSFAARIPMKSIAMALEGQETEDSQEALQVLDIILRQHSAKQ